MRNAHYRTSNMARKLTNKENDKKREMYTVGPGYGEKTEKLGKLDTQTL